MKLLAKWEQKSTDYLIPFSIYVIKFYNICISYILFEILFEFDYSIKNIFIEFVAYFEYFVGEERTGVMVVMTIIII